MITIVPYDASWPEAFVEVARPLRIVLGQLALRIDHIGSTSVPAWARAWLTSAASAPTVPSDTGTSNRASVSSSRPRVLTCWLPRRHARVAARRGPKASALTAAGMGWWLRWAQPGQVRQIVELYQSEREHYGKDAKAALALATEPLGPLPAGADAGELAAWTVVANVLLNLDETLTKE